MLTGAVQNVIHAELANIVELMGHHPRRPHGGGSSLSLPPSLSLSPSLLLLIMTRSTGIAIAGRYGTDWTQWFGSTKHPHGRRRRCIGIGGCIGSGSSTDGCDGRFVVHHYRQRVAVAVLILLLIGVMMMVGLLPTNWTLEATTATATTSNHQVGSPGSFIRHGYNPQQTGRYLHLYPTTIYSITNTCTTIAAINVMQRMKRRRRAVVVAPVACAVLPVVGSVGHWDRVAALGIGAGSVQ
mmetsp:Transcript_37062/g.81251  ORF Transcript_37062/g.81251 Transcript_37062/m.81251 type:complete len:240 (+) Transcript_37062:2033-2752(+)